MSKITDPSIRGELVKQTTETEGWGIILEEITYIMNRARNQLITVDPADAIKIAEIQSCYKAHERLVNKIIEITKEV